MPIVWRTILIRPETKLAMFHRYVQAAMGWRDCHLFAFTIGAKEYGIPAREWESEKKMYDARRYTLARLFTTIPAGCGYLYDFGDGWEHTIEIEGSQDAEFRKQYPVCIDGAEPCPPEDSGGPGGYKELRRVLADPLHPDHAEWKLWAESKEYYSGFSLRFATAMMREVQRSYI